MTSPDASITLYDVPFGGKATSPSMWKARYVLNFKGIPYKTIWLEYPQIEPTMRGIGAAPTGTKPDGTPFYTLPVIVDYSHTTPSGGPTVVSESFLIAEYLDSTYPTPGPLFPDGTAALQKLFYDNVYPSLLMPILPILLPHVYPTLNKESRPYWRATREALLGGKLETFCVKGSPKWNESWLNVQKALTQLAVLLDKNGDNSTLVMGQSLTFSDLTTAAFLECIFVALPDEWNDKVRSWDNGRWEKLRERCGEWRAVH